MIADTVARPVAVGAYIETQRSTTWDRRCQRAWLRNARRRRRPSRRRNTFRVVASFAAWITGGFVATLLLALTALSPVGIHSYIVESASMRPAIDTGDIVIDRTIHPTAARIGDTITFRDPLLPNRTITHRVRAISRHDNTISFTTMGIANNTTQKWNVPANGKIGRVEWRVPQLGWVLATAHTQPGVTLLVVVPILALSALALRHIWTPHPPKTRNDSHRHRLTAPHP